MSALTAFPGATSPLYNRRKTSARRSLSRSRNVRLRAAAAPAKMVEVKPNESARLPDFNTEPAPSQKVPENFVWEKNWYPVSAVEDLDPTAPHGEMILDAAGEWHCLQDKCPHRLSPLSEGRIMDGMLMCSYHGWKIRPDGKVGAIPQAQLDPVPLTPRCNAEPALRATQSSGAWAAGGSGLMPRLKPSLR
ncbi:hypothetical protein WJX84_007698, partial [Apatococcus fuscideae]